MVTAFVGDIHGCSEALADLLKKVDGSADRLVFLGDYVNRGPNSRAVLDLLIELESRTDRNITFLAGNHDRALLKSLGDDAAIYDLLRMGGAATIRSYVEAPYRDVLSQLRRSFPDSHQDFLSSLSTSWSDGEVFATHDAADAPDDFRYIVAGHAAQTMRVPTVTPHRALIDTGCGTIRGGKLTCFYWPTKAWVQSTVTCI